MRSIFIFAHPDDEFGCYESIRREVALRRQVECYYLTDGGYGKQSVERREAESLCVLSRLGVATNAVHFLGRHLGVPDGSLPQHMVVATTALADKVVDQDGVAAVYVPAWEGGHQDHDAAHLIAVAIIDRVKSRDGCYQFSLYHGEGLKGGFFHVLKPISLNGERLRLAIPMKYRLFYLRLCLSYPSQWKTWVGLFPFVLVKLLFGGCYYLQHIDSHRVYERPHTGPLLYERRGMASFTDFEHSALKFLEANSTSSSRF